MSVYVVVLNYNGWKDTIELLETLLKSDYCDFKIIVCDNGSTNESWEYLTAWAEGKVKAQCSMKKIIQKLFFPIVQKPISYEIYDRNNKKIINNNSKVIFVPLTKNRGFAGGMNKGIDIALRDPDCQFVWCLNNDTVVDPSVMSKMVEQLRQHPDCGICSSYTRSYYFPEKSDSGKSRIRVNKWLGTNEIFLEDSEDPIGQFKDYDGASFMVTRRFVETVGLMDEQYFLYFEEPDWTIRGWKRGFKVVYCTDGNVYHKVGASTKGEARSYLSDYYMIRSRILFTRKFYPYCLPTVYMGLCVSILNRLRRKQYNRIWMILKLMLNPKPLLKTIPEREKK